VRYPFSRSGSPKKNGDAMLHPRTFCFTSVSTEAYFFFFVALAFFFAGILFSSQLLQNIPPAKLAERVFIIMYSDCDCSCQEESDEKSFIGMSFSKISAAADRN
jgi:hypothetical protein